MRKEQCYLNEVEEKEYIELKQYYTALCDLFPDMTVDVESVKNKRQPNSHELFLRADLDINSFPVTLGIRLRENEGRIRFWVNWFSDDYKSKDNVFNFHYFRIPCNVYISQNPLSHPYKNFELFVKHIQSAIECIKINQEGAVLEWLNNCNVDKNLEAV